MHREEQDEQVRCAGCGMAFWPDAGRGFGFGTGGYVCWECAIQRGGVYDADRDRWSVAPDVADLPDEERPHR